MTASASDPRVNSIRLEVGVVKVTVFGGVSPFATIRVAFSQGRRDSRRSLYITVYGEKDLIHIISTLQVGDTILVEGSLRLGTKMERNIPPVEINAKHVSVLRKHEPKAASTEAASSPDGVESPRDIV
jgi:aspartyl/asparaginyl-tRNA synthetase